MSEQLTLIEEAFALTVVEGENLQLTLDGGNGPAGPAGAAGAAGPNTVTTSTSTTLTGYIFGNGTTIAGATAAASAATPSTLVVRTSGGAASFTGITNNGALTLSTGTTFTYGAGIAAAHRTALGLGSLATQNGTFSGTSSGTNTGDQDLSNLLSRRTYLEVNGTDAPISQSLVEQGYLSNGRRVWANGDGGTLLYDGASWFLTQLDPDSLVVYDAFKTSGSYEPWLLTGWTVTNGSGEPTFVVDPADPLGNGVIIALDLPADTNGGFLTAGTGGTLPITRGGTGATNAGSARTALGATATGVSLFTALTPAAARTTLGARTFTKPTDESRSSTTYTVDTHLKDIPLEAGKSYKIEFYIPAYVPTTEGGKVRLLLPLSSRVTVPNMNGGVSVTNWGNGAGGSVSTTASGAPTGMRYFTLQAAAGHAQNRAIAGVAYTDVIASSANLSLEWAQNAPGANATILLAGATLTVTEL